MTKSTSRSLFAAISHICSDSREILPFCPPQKHNQGRKMSKGIRTGLISYPHGHLTCLCINQWTTNTQRTSLITHWEISAVIRHLDDFGQAPSRLDNPSRTTLHELHECLKCQLCRLNKCFIWTHCLTELFSVNTLLKPLVLQKCHTIVHK